MANLAVFVVFILSVKFGDPSGGFFRGGVLLLVSLLLFLYLVLLAADFLFIRPRLSHDDSPLPEWDDDEKIAPPSGGFAPRKYLGEIDEGAEVLDEFDRAGGGGEAGVGRGGVGDDFFRPGPRR